MPNLLTKVTGINISMQTPEIMVNWYDKDYVSIRTIIFTDKSEAAIKSWLAHDFKYSGVSYGATSYKITDISTKKFPRYRYDCGRCKWKWNCGYACRCWYSSLPIPPVSIHGDIDRAKGIWPDSEFNKR